jgi:hypothetical protein
MQARVKVFTLASGEGSTISDTDLEQTVNQWLASVEGRLVQVTQSESHRPGKAQHITLCVWYVPDEA